MKWNYKINNINYLILIFMRGIYLIVFEIKNKKKKLFAENNYLYISL